MSTQIPELPELIQEFKKHAKKNYYNGYHEFVDCYTDEDLMDFFEDCSTLSECLSIVQSIVHNTNS